MPLAGLRISLTVLSPFLGLRRFFLVAELLLYSYLAADTVRELFVESSHVNPDAIPESSDPDIIEQDEANGGAEEISPPQDPATGTDPDEA
jgi:hypothetical protein